MSKHRCQSKPHKVHLLSSHLPQLKPQWLLAACRIKCKLLPCHSLPTHYISPKPPCQGYAFFSFYISCILTIVGEAKLYLF